MTTQLGLAFRNARLAAGLGLNAAAKKIGVSGAYLSQIEHGQRTKPADRVLSAASTLYGVPLDDLCVAADAVPADVMDYLMSDSRLFGALREAAGHGMTADDLRSAIGAWLENPEDWR